MKIGSTIRYRSRVSEWTCRILISFNMLIPGFLFGDIEHEYPLDVLLMTLIAFWLYLYRLHLIAILLLLLTAFINYIHIIT